MKFKNLELPIKLKQQLQSPGRGCLSACLRGTRAPWSPLPSPLCSLQREFGCLPASGAFDLTRLKTCKSRGCKTLH